MNRRQGGDDNYPNIVLVTGLYNEWYYYPAFLRHSNVFLVSEDTVTSKVRVKRRCLLYKYANNKFIRKILYRVLGSRVPVPIEKWMWQKKEMCERGIDAIIYVQTAVLPRKYPKCLGDPKILYISWDADILKFQRYQKAIAEDGLIDAIFVSHESHRKYFENLNVDIIHLPYGAVTDVFYPRQGEQLFQPIFIGTLSEGRRKFINKVNEILKRKKLPVIRNMFGLGLHRYAHSIWHHGIVIDMPRRREVTWRTFETTASKALLITNIEKEIEKYYKIGKEILIYSNINNLVEIIENIYDNKEYYVKISENGYKRTIEEHTMDHRVCKIINYLGYKCNPKYT